jgi:hypothetical protein
VILFSGKLGKKKMVKIFGRRNLKLEKKRKLL